MVKAILSALIIVAVSELAKRSPSMAALLASLPLISVLGMIWLWRDVPDPERKAKHAEATFRYVLPRLPMFLLSPARLRRGADFHLALGAGLALTVALYLITAAIVSRLGVQL